MNIEVPHALQAELEALSCKLGSLWPLVEPLEHGVQEQLGECFRNISVAVKMLKLPEPDLSCNTESYSLPGSLPLESSLLFLAPHTATPLHNHAGSLACSIVIQGDVEVSIYLSQKLEHHYRLQLHDKQRLTSGAFQMLPPARHWVHSISGGKGISCLLDLHYPRLSRPDRLIYATLAEDGNGDLLAQAFPEGEYFT